MIRDEQEPLEAIQGTDRFYLGSLKLLQKRLYTSLKSEGLSQETASLTLNSDSPIMQECHPLPAVLAKHAGTRFHITVAIRSKASQHLLPLHRVTFPWQSYVKSSFSP